MNRLSTLQYNMLRMFATAKDEFHMSIDQAARYDQRPFRSMLIREWIAYRPGRGFHITDAGRKEWADFRSHSILRSNPFGPLTAMFDYSQYGLAPTKRKRAAAAKRKAA